MMKPRPGPAMKSVMRGWWFPQNWEPVSIYIMPTAVDLFLDWDDLFPPERGHFSVFAGLFLRVHFRIKGQVSTPALECQFPMDDPCGSGGLLRLGCTNARWEIPANGGTGFRGATYSAYSHLCRGWKSGCDIRGSGFGYDPGGRIS